MNGRPVIWKLKYIVEKNEHLDTLFYLLFRILY